LFFSTAAPYCIRAEIKHGLPHSKEDKNECQAQEQDSKSPKKLAVMKKKE
jgi:hypothetical protein